MLERALSERWVDTGRPRLFQPVEGRALTDETTTLVREHAPSDTEQPRAGLVRNVLEAPPGDQNTSPTMSSTLAGSIRRIA
jgi:hypothetical protein